MHLRRPPTPPGFTLMEIMVVLAILAILATLAVPSFQERNLRAQVVDGEALAGFVRQAVADQYRLAGVLPRDNAAAGVPPADHIVGRYVASVEVRDGAVILTFGNQASRALAGRRLGLRPAVVEGYPQVPVAWICAGAPVPGKMTVVGIDATDVPAPYLPFDCRGGPAASAPRG